MSHPKTSYFKENLRDEYRRILTHLPPLRHLEAACHAHDFLKNYLKNTPGLVMSYYSMPDELNLWTVNHLLAQEDRLVLPSVSRLHNDLHAFKVPLANTRFLKCHYNIWEPDPTKCEEIDPDDLDLIIVPAIAFDRHYTRLGRGGGHYDRLLSQIDPNVTKIIGVGFKEQMSLDPLPREDHDIPLSDIFLF